MKHFAPVRRLEVFRRFTTGARVAVGTLAAPPAATARKRRGVFFQYHDEYLRRHPNLSPFRLPFDGRVHAAPGAPHDGLHGVFADSLPDGWGRLVMARLFRQQGGAPEQITPLDWLALAADRGSGALEYAPASPFAPAVQSRVEVALLGERARQLFEDKERAVEVPPALAQAASSGGARPKAVVYLPPDGTDGAALRPGPGLHPWLVKFTSSSLPLGHEEGLCEAAYLTLAAQAGIDVPEWRLIAPPSTSPAIAWLAQKRFDHTAQGRRHMHSLCGLLDADYRAPSMDYEDLIRASAALCRSPAAAQAQFARAMFNLFAVNQDDHTKNWAFLQDDAGRWCPAPFFDVTFSPAPHGEHATAFLGHGEAPPLAAARRLAEQAGFRCWADARHALERVVAALAGWPETAANLGVRARTVELVAARLRAALAANKALLG